MADKGDGNASPKGEGPIRPIVASSEGQPSNTPLPDQPSRSPNGSPRSSVLIDRGATYYRMAIASANKVPPFGPPMPVSAIFRKDGNFREFLFTKCTLFKVSH